MRSRVEQTPTTTLPSRCNFVVNTFQLFVQRFEMVYVQVLVCPRGAKWLNATRVQLMWGQHHSRWTRDAIARARRLTMPICLLGHCTLTITLRWFSTVMKRKPLILLQIYISSISIFIRYQKPATMTQINLPQPKKYTHECYVCINIITVTH